MFCSGFNVKNTLQFVNKILHVSRKKVSSPAGRVVVGAVLGLVEVVLFGFVVGVVVGFGVVVSSFAEACPFVFRASQDRLEDK